MLDPISQLKSDLKEKLTLQKKKKEKNTTSKIQFVFIYPTNTKFNKTDTYRTNRDPSPPPDTEFFATASASDDDFNNKLQQNGSLSNRNSKFKSAKSNRIEADSKLANEFATSSSTKSSLTTTSLIPPLPSSSIEDIVRFSPVAPSSALNNFSSTFISSNNNTQNMAMVRKKQDDKYLEALRELITTGGGNRQCFDCGQKGPTYVNMTIGSFVCTRCSGVLRGITPPHRVKSISMATFTQDEIDFLKAHGNDVCAKTWLGLWDPKRAVHQDQRELMIDKYERKRYYLEPASPLKSLTNATNLKTTTSTAAATTSATSSASITASSANSTQNNINNKAHIQLTPPTSQRTTANGLHKTSSSAISRPQHTTPPQSQNGFSSSLSNHNTDAFGLHNGLNSSVGSMSTGALSDTSSCASANGFGAEADFVADFGSADIFNATVASSPASSVGSSTTNNGYAKIQPMKMSSAANQQFMNGHGGGGGNNVSTNLQNGNLTNGNTENFADFDHAPIYNAAVEEPPNYQFVRKNAIRKKSTSSISGSIIRRNERQLKDILEMDNNENPVDYINFNEDDVFGESTTTKTTTTNTTKSGGYSNLFDDFDTLLSLDNADNTQQTKFKEFESDYVNVGREYLANGSSSKFTPLALAAHATAMAVLGNQSHFNTQLQAAEVAASKPVFTNQWDVWSTARDTTKTSTTMATTTPWFPNNNNLMQVPPTQQQQQQFPYASIGNYNSGNLQQQLQQALPTQQQQYYPSSTFSTQSLTQSSATKFENAKTSATTSTSIITTTASPTTSLPINNNNNNKNSTTNGFNNNIHNNNNINNNNNSSAPAEDRYAALKDLDEQLRESKAVAAQAASIVTANVVDSGFGNPNVNGTVNPFATHHHQQQTAVVNPFQNVANNPTQNTTQQLFGQMTLIPNGIAAANGFLNAQKTHTANTGFFNYTASGFTNANTPQIQHQQQQQQQHQASILYPTSIQTGPNGCGFGFGTLQQQIASTGTGLTTNTFNNPFAPYLKNNLKNRKKT
ncbi:hypothetical protein FF38_09407 [Lucilia cuprina]|uniref:Arf-GAP domain-containing protein n=1 Tax=Lucilia cuprina TaxID=7375 RepID=A0A0L0C8Y2_LUCCU|nr:hypothetical protein FF38_09407 [Lucilia cuprina]